MKVMGVLAKLVEWILSHSKTFHDMGDSQASFTPSVRTKIRQTYKYRCVICLAWIKTTQCTHLLDTATQGELQVRSEVMVCIGSSKF